MSTLLEQQKLSQKNPSQTVCWALWAAVGMRRRGLPLHWPVRPELWLSVPAERQTERQSGAEESHHPRHSQTHVMGLT